MRKKLNSRQQVIKRVFYGYKYRCYLRNTFWGLTPQDLEKLIFLPCHYCNAPPQNKYTRYPYTYYSGLDRKDNKKGYHINNTVPCCQQCNSIKGQYLTYEETKAAIKAILEYRSRTSKKVPKPKAR